MMASVPVVAPGENSLRLKTKMNHPMKTLNRLFAFAALMLVGLAAFSVRATDTTESHGQFSTADYKFATDTARDGMMNAGLCKQTADKSTNSVVKDFAAAFIQDQDKTMGKLKEIAAKNSATLPMVPGAVGKAEVLRLQNLSGAEYDAGFLSVLVFDLEADLKAFKQAADGADNADLKSFATENISAIENNLAKAKDLKKSVQAAAGN